MFFLLSLFTLSTSYLILRSILYKSKESIKYAQKMLSLCSGVAVITLDDTMIESTTNRADLTNHKNIENTLLYLARYGIRIVLVQIGTESTEVSENSKKMLGRVLQEFPTWNVRPDSVRLVCLGNNPDEVEWRMCEAIPNGDVQLFIIGTDSIQQNEYSRFDCIDNTKISFLTKKTECLIRLTKYCTWRMTLKRSGMMEIIIDSCLPSPLTSLYTAQQMFFKTWAESIKTEYENFGITINIRDKSSALLAFSDIKVALEAMEMRRSAFGVYLKFIDSNITCFRYLFSKCFMSEIKNRITYCIAPNFFKRNINKSRQNKILDTLRKQHNENKYKFTSGILPETKNAPETNDASGT